MAATLTMHYRDEGTGEPPVVLLHAFPLTSEMWDAQIAALSPRWRVLAPDLQGFGRTEAPEDPDAYSIDSYADEVAGLLDELGIAKVVLAGLSLGGYIAFAFVRRHRERVMGLVLADTRAAADSDEVAERRVAQQRQVADRGTAELIETSLRNLLSDYTRQHRPEVVEHARALMAGNPPAGVIGALGAMLHRADATDDLAGIEIPTLVIVGADDKPSPPSVAKEMTEQLPNARLAIIETAGHLSNLEAPGPFNQALTAFLEDLSDGS